MINYAFIPISNINKSKKKAGEMLQLVKYMLCEQEKLSQGLSTMECLGVVIHVCISSDCCCSRDRIILEIH